MSPSPRVTTPKRAAAKAGVTSKTIRLWAARYGIGLRIVGRWQIDEARLDALLEGGAHGQ